MWSVVYLTDAELERDKLPAHERQALYNAVQKLKRIGPVLPYPHSSDVRGVSGLRELRPRRGRGPWRALYRQMGDIFVIAAVCPEAMVDEREFKKAGERALKRLEDLEEE